MGTNDSIFFTMAQNNLEMYTGKYCIIDVDLEYYKQFVEWYGIKKSQFLIEKTDDILKKVAAQNNGLYKYMGMEKFCIIIPYDEELINNIHTEIKKTISLISDIEGFSPLFGIAMIDGSTNDIYEYFNHASLACDENKGNVHSRISMYDSEFHKTNSQEYRLLYEFQHAIENNEILFWVQPQYSVANRKVVGAESLARWKKSDEEWISPAIFVPILEKYGIVTRLDKYIWESVCKWIRSMIDRDLPIVPISVNISQIDIISLDVPGFFKGLLKKYDLPSSSIKLEITESAYVDNAELVNLTVSKLRAMGFMVMMDDFGSGYSSLNKLNSISVDLIKLDAKFLNLQDEVERKGVSILESVVNMTRNLSIPIIVEGVENETQAKLMSDLGCVYMQGFFFDRPMPVEQFEKLIHNSSVIDSHGFVFKANEQIHVREFLDENVYSDTMLNNILGPVAFVNVSNENNIDIIRFNEQFYEMINLSIEDFEETRHRIHEYTTPEDLITLNDMFDYAKQHKTLGARGVIRFNRSSGITLWLSLLIYYINENESGSKYYVSARDVTELQFISSDLPGAYFRTTLDDGYNFLFVSNNFQELTGFTDREIKILFEGKLINMIHPDDIDMVKADAKNMKTGESSVINPYRIRRKKGDYIYVAEQSRITDKYGNLCWQCMLIDVTEVMNIRNQMHILSDSLSDSVLFLHDINDQLSYEVVIHGLSDVIGLDDESFELALNTGEFCKWISGYDPTLAHSDYTRFFVESTLGNNKVLEVNLPSGKKIELSAHIDAVDDKQSNIAYVVHLRRI